MLYKKLEALKSLCRSPWPMCILTMDTDKFMTKWCFGDGNVFVDLSLLNILVATIISIYNELGPVISGKCFLKIYKN